MMRTRRKTIQAGHLAAGPDKRPDTAYNRPTMFFLKLMALTARTEETRTIYLSFIKNEQTSVPQQKGN